MTDICERCDGARGTHEDWCGEGPGRWDDEPCVCDTDFTCMAREHEDVPQVDVSLAGQPVATLAVTSGSVSTDRDMPPRRTLDAAL